MRLMCERSSDTISPDDYIDPFERDALSDDSVVYIVHAPFTASSHPVFVTVSNLYQLLLLQSMWS